MNARNGHMPKRPQVGFESRKEGSKPLKWNGKDIRIGLYELIANCYRIDPAVVNRYLLCSCTLMNGDLRVLRPGLLGVQVGQWHIRNTHFVRGRICKESEIKHLQSVHRSHRLQFLIDCTHQDLPPKAID